MSIIKRPYEISVWEDVYDDGTTTLVFPDYTNEKISNTDGQYVTGAQLIEKKIAVIGSSDMIHQGRITEPQINFDVKNKSTLTFTIYRKYYDNITGELVDNPFYKYITNERKIKLKYEDENSDDPWYDFIIESIQKDSQTYKTTVICIELAVVELSKLGFNKTFNSELQNNTNTINNLAKTLLDNTVWGLSDESEEILQYQNDNLVQLKMNWISGTPVNIHLFTNDFFNVGENKIITLDSQSTVYLFYSQLTLGKDNIKELSLLFLPNTAPSSGNWTTRIATNKDYINNVIQNVYYGTIDVSNMDWKSLGDTGLYIPQCFSENDYAIFYTKKGERLIQNQLTHYDKILNRYVKEYRQPFKIDRLVQLWCLPSARGATTVFLVPTSSQQLEKKITFKSGVDSGPGQVIYGFLNELINKGDENGYVHFFFIPNTTINENPLSTKVINSNNDLKNGYLCIADKKASEINWQEKIGVVKDSSTITLYLPYSCCFNSSSSDILITNYQTNYNSDIINGYEDFEYTVTPLVQNLITNGEKELSLDGWFLSSNTQIRDTRLKLGMARPEQSINTRENYEPYPFIQIGTRYNTNNILNSPDEPTIDQPKADHTHFTSFVLNSGFQDNRAIINNLKKNDKFRMRINVERNITLSTDLDSSNSNNNSNTQTYASLAVLQGFKPFILRLPKGTNSTDIMEDISKLKCNISTPDSDGYITITNNPVIVDFSYIPKEYRMFDYDRVFYQQKNSPTSFTKITELAPLGVGTLIPIRLRINENLSKPVMYAPYWRLYDLIYNRQIVKDLYKGSAGTSFDDGTYNGSSNGFYLTNSTESYDNHYGYEEYINYWLGKNSYLRPLDFCIAANPSEILSYTKAEPGSGYDHDLHKKESFSASTKIHEYYVMFSRINSPNRDLKNEEQQAEKEFYRPNAGSINSSSSWITELQKTFKYREMYKSNKNSSDATGEYYLGYYDYNHTLHFLQREEDGLSISGAVDLSISGTVIKYSWNYIQEEDIDNILRIRNIWRIKHYEPYDIGNNRIIPYSYCTFETEGTFLGVIDKTRGPSWRNYSVSTGDGNTVFSNIDYKDTVLTLDDLEEQENVIFFSSYGSYGSDLAVLGNGYMPLTLSKILLTRYYKDENNHIVTPDTIPAASTRTIYRYFNSNYGRCIKIDKKEDIVYDYTGYVENSSYTKNINTKGIAYNSITVTESNVYNILQKLCEIFNCWLKIKIPHNKNGNILYNNDGKIENAISFHKYIGDNLHYGFSYGINTNTIQRTDISEDIVTKMITKQNSNEFGINKFCTITRSKYNILGGNDIYNFDYYINQGLLTSEIYNLLYKTYGTPLDTIRKQILLYEEDLRQLVVELAQLKAEQDYYKTQYESATKEVTSAKKYFEDLTKKSYNYYLNNKTTMDEEWSKDGLISLYEQYKEQIDYYTGMRSTAEILLNNRTEQYNNKYAEYTKKNSLIEILTEHRERIMGEFYKIYHAYIREGSWISEDYLDDNKYFFAAKDVLNTSAQPKVTYTFNVVDVGALEEFKGYNFKLGDKTYVEDPEFFGYEEDGITPYKEEVTISGMQINLDSPEKNTITIQNYRTQFQDLFQRIAATVQAVEYHTGNYRNTKTERP